MTDLDRLIRLNVELEGLLKVLLDRDSIHARSLLAEKFDEYSRGLSRYLAEGAPATADAAVLGQAQALAAEAHSVEVKDQEAVDPEVADETDAATAAIEAGEEHAAEAEAVAEEPVVVEPVAEIPEAPVPPVAPEVIGEEPVAEEPVAEAAAAPEAVENTKLLRAFTLNDKFRFRRELFNGDIEDFADTLSLLAHMPSYAEAVDYLTNDLLWDTRNPNVEDFFAILKDNMPS